MADDFGLSEWLPQISSSWSPSTTPTDFSSFAADAAPAGGGFWGGLSDFASKMGSGLGKEFSDSPLKAFSGALGIGATGMGMANQIGAMDRMKGAEKQIAQGQQAAQAAAAPAVRAGTANIENAQAGKLQPAQEASIAEWVQKAKADLRGRYASMGLGNSTDIQQGEAQIDQMALSMRGQLLQGQEALGYQGVGMGVGAAQGATASATQQQQMLAQLLGAADEQLARLGASQK